MIDFQGAAGFILLREIDKRFSIIDPTRDCLEDLRSPAHTKHALVSEELVCSKFREKVFFQGNLCYHGVDARIRLQE
jgi:hypothetical protein